MAAVKLGVLLMTRLSLIVEWVSWIGSGYKGGPDEISERFIQCSVDNSANHFIGACNSPSKTQSLHQHGNAACQARLISINLHERHCEDADLVESSLNFTFDLPICESSVAEAVMVNFKARDAGSYYDQYPLCHVFDFSGSDFQLLNSNHSIQIAYDCMVTGLSETYYFLVLSSLPSEIMLNYTVVFKDANSSFLRLVAAAWRSVTQLHVIFLPVRTVTKYLVHLKSGTWNFSLKALSQSSVEFTNIPSEIDNITVTVKPFASECKHKELFCSPLEMSLSRRKMENLSSTDKLSVWWGWKSIVTLIGGIALTAVLIAAFIRGFHRHRQPDDEENMLQLLKELHRVMFIANPSRQAQSLQKTLQTHKFEVADALQAKTGHITMMKNHHFIIICLHPLITNSRYWPDILQLIKLIFENRQLWTKVRVVFFHKKSQGPEACQVLSNNFNSHLWPDFLKFLDQNTYYIPRDMDKLVNSFETDSERIGEFVRYSENDGHISISGKGAVYPLKL